MIIRHDSSSSEDESEKEDLKEKKPETKEQLRKREELEDSDASINFSESKEEEIQQENNLKTKIKNLAAKEALMGKNAKTIIRDKEGNISDLKNSKEIQLAEINKLNQLIVKIIS